MCCRRCRRAPHGVGERCTSTPHAPHESAQRGHAQQGHEQQVHATRAWEAQARITQAYTASALSGQGAHQPAVSSGQRSAHLHLESPMNSCCKAARSCQRPGVRDRLQHAASSAATRSRAAATFVSTRAHFPVSTCSCNGSLCGRMLAAAGRQRQVRRLTVPGRLRRPPQALCEVMPTA